jgi:hypothetical protein
MHITKNVCINTLNTLMDTRGDIEGFTSHTLGHATIGNQEAVASRAATEWPVLTFGCVMDREGRRKACAYFFL